MPKFLSCKLLEWFAYLQAYFLITCNMTNQLNDPKNMEKEIQFCALDRVRELPNSYFQIWVSQKSSHFLISCVQQVQ